MGHCWLVFWGCSDGEGFELGFRMNKYNVKMMVRKITKTAQFCFNKVVNFPKGKQHEWSLIQYSTDKN